MKQHWQKLAEKIDGLSLRERIVIFVLLAIVAIVAFNALLLDPLFAKQKHLSQQVKADQAVIEQMQEQMRQAVKGEQDPDAANRARLKEARQQLESMHAQLLEMEKGLVSPERMPALLGDILKRDRRLTLLSLKTLAAAPLTESGNMDSAAAGANGNKPETPGAEIGPVFRHGVEIVVQGTYLDMVQYMDALESMPWQVFWSKAKLQVDEYPQSTLTLTLYTLSLDKKWLNL
ncbi:MAG: MSHA biogenesis protein MshJ [Burkholderiaceae bacterium]